MMMNEFEKQVRNVLFVGGREMSYGFGSSSLTCARLLAVALVLLGMGGEYMAGQGVQLHFPESYPQKTMPQCLRELMAQGTHEQRMHEAELLCRAWEEANPVLKDALLPLLSSMEYTEWSTEVMAEVLRGLADAVDGQPAERFSDLVSACFASLLGEGEVPESLTRLCACVVTAGKAPRGGARAYDPFCASGGMLASLWQRGAAILSGETPNATLAAMARLRLLFSAGGAAVRTSDALSSPAFTAGTELELFDYVVSAPPRCMEYRVESAEQDAYGRFALGVPHRQQGEWAYLLHMLAHAEPCHGVVAAFVSGAPLFRSEVTAKIFRRTLTEENVLDAVVALPSCVIPYASIPPMLLVLRRGRTRRTVRFVDAQGLGQRTRRQTLFRAEDTEKILAALATEEPLPGFARSVTAEEIAAADYVWSVNRYVLPVAEEKSIDLPRLQANIERLERELAEKQAQLEALLAAW